MSSTIRLRRTAVAAVTALLVVAAALVAVLQSKPAEAAELTRVGDFGDNPGDLEMYLYVPDNVAPEPGLLVAVHYCTGTGPAFHDGTRYAELSEQYGYIVVYPSVTRSSQCFDVASPESLSGTGGDSVSIKSMVDHVLAEYGADPDRVYATGVSSGAMMTNVLLGVYPAVFAAGSAYAGVPYTCFATGGGSEWNSECADGEVDRTPQQWGDEVRDANPGYNGPWPRMQTWHGTEDETLAYPNFNEQIEQWTDVHGTDQNPDRTDAPQSNWTRTRYGGTGGQAPVEAISMQGTPHNLPVQETETLRFLGLDTEPPDEATTTPPRTTGPPPGGGCSAVIEVVNDWGSGWQADVSVTGPADGWTLGWTWPGDQGISSSWNARISESEASVTASDVGWNGTIASGRTRQVFGFIGSGPATEPAVTCTAA
ncbi:extracellular catalytic domain type 1 short-chain-length polyhydroxyalkanoate depolymerase [Glycomyces xiaoerkulensis]|uniref:extracellular catalytic domain type 1 short-chain-length polyhydroxyalkanoate depolymerase n=1 Tax=Glycomyces xiaoerkulensis TaxID=2038139 RepID=UPI000C26BCFF|nr:PHB depolymerase family esterase [Glycomyces xiaoerkulensis]